MEGLWRGCGGAVKELWRGCGGAVEGLWRGCGGAVEGLSSAVIYHSCQLGQNHVAMGLIDGRMGENLYCLMRLEM